MIRKRGRNFHPCDDFFHGIFYLHCAPAGHNFVQGAGEGCSFPGPKSGTWGKQRGRFAIDMLRHPLEIDMGMHKRAVRQREYPIFEMVVGVDDGEHGVAHMPHLIAAGGIHQIEFHRLPIG